MLHVVILIAKIIGLIILVLIGILLLILLTVLLAPVRYKGNGSFYGKPEGTAVISWLLHIVSAKISFKEEFSVEVRLFGFRILKDRGAEPEEEMKEAAEALYEDGKETAEDVILSAQEVTGEEDRPAEDSGEEEKIVSEPRAEAETVGQAEKTEYQKETEEFTVPPANAKKGLFSRLFEKIKNIFEHLCRTFKILLKKLKQAENLKDTVKTYITDEENKKTFQLLVKQGKKVIRHILPGKLRGTVTFGFDDPYRTGQILTGAAFFYPVYRNSLTVCPVFDRKILEGELWFKGRIRMGTLLLAGLKVLMNRNFRTQLKRFLNRGGA